MAVRGGADVDGDEDVGLGVGRWLATGKKIGPGTSNGVFDNVCDEGREDNGDGKGEVGGFMFVG